MGETLIIKITESAGEALDVRHRFIWSARLGGRLLEQGHAFDPEDAGIKAMNLVARLGDSEEVEQIEVLFRCRGFSRDS